MADDMYDRPHAATGRHSQTGEDVSLLRRPVMFAAAALLATGMTALGAASASAQTSAAKPAPAMVHLSQPSGFNAVAAATCPGEAFCAWDGTSDTGTQWNYNATVLPLKTWLPIRDCSSNNENCPGANDAISSIFNNRVNITYIGKNFPNSGASTCYGVFGGDGDINLATLDWFDNTSMNNSISSVRLTTVTTPVAGFCDGQL
jgi:hypothetical protein